jgi:hypothetical protein
MFGTKTQGTMTTGMIPALVEANRVMRGMVGNAPDAPFEGFEMRLTAPRMLFFILSLVIALLAVLSAFVTGMPDLPIDNFWIMAIAYVVLALACLIP